MNFLCFGVTGLLSPVFARGLAPTSGQGETLNGFQHGLVPLVFGIAVAIVLSFFLRETGHGATESERATPAQLPVLVNER